MIAAARTLTGSKRREWEKSVIGDSRLSKSTDVFLITVILGYCRGKSECWPTVKTLAKHMRVTERTIQSSVKRCIKAGVIETVDDPMRYSGRRFVVLSHPSLGQVENENFDGNEQAKSSGKPRKSCTTPSQNLYPKLEVKTEYSSSSSLCSEESSSKPEPKAERVTTTDLPQALIQEISRSLPERDAKAILGAGRVIARKAMGKWDLVSKAIAYIKRQRDSIKGVVPYLVSIVDSWANQGIPSHILDLLTPRIELATDGRRAVSLTPEKRKIWEDLYKRQHAKAIARSRPIAGLS